MDNFLELVKKRQSVRKYSATSVHRDKIERCLEAARLAPSACNSQPWSFIVVDDQELKNKIAEKATSQLIKMNTFTKQAPVMVAVITEKSNLTAKIGGLIKDKQYNLMDVGIAVSHFCLQAAEEGLGTCILGWFDEKGVKKLLGISRKKSIDLIITLGYPALQEIRPKNRKSMDDIRRYN